VFLGSDAVALTAALLIAFVLRFEGEIPGEYHSRLPVFVAIALLSKIPVCYFFGLYRMSWSYASLHDLVNVAKAAAVGSLLFGAAVLIGLRDTGVGRGVPRSVVAIDFAVGLLLVGGVRSARRVYLSMSTRRGPGGRRLLIVGAGAAGELLIRELQRSSGLRYRIVGLVDDDPVKMGLALHGVRVLGRRHDIPRLVESEAVDEIVIAMPSAPPRTISELTRICRGTRAAVKILPSMYHSLVGQVRVGHLREIRVEDLLPRKPVRMDSSVVADLVRGECVLVTGAGGSIGSELCRQVAVMGPRRLVLVGNAENDIFEIETELRGLGISAEITPVIGDVRHADKMHRVFQWMKPAVVFHAAAHKHVGLMELNPDEAISNNVLGTKIIAEACERFGVGRMVFVSTDKAVSPRSIMGASKRLAELVIQSMVQTSQTRFMIVRFGNVLNSTGSVIPIFQRQIARGGPVTVTDTAMTRYFMTIPEAVHLIIHACAMGRGGEVFVLDMGEPVRIMDLAEQMIRLSGLEPHEDIEIRVIGAREGEKLHEELTYPGEALVPTGHERIFQVTSQLTPDPGAMDRAVVDLVKSASELDGEAIRRKLMELVGTRA